MWDSGSIIREGHSRAKAVCECDLGNSERGDEFYQMNRLNDDVIDPGVTLLSVNLLINSALR